MRVFECLRLDSGLGNRSKAQVDADVAGTVKVDGETKSMTNPTDPPIPLGHLSCEALWTTAEVARFLACTPRHVVNLQMNGLPHFYVGRLVRFDPAEVRAFLRDRRRLESGVKRRRSRFASQLDLARN